MYSFLIYSKLPRFLRSIISLIIYKPKFGKNVMIYGWPIYGPNVDIGDYTYLHSPNRLENIKIGKFCGIAENFTTFTHTHNNTNNYNYKFNWELNSPFYSKYDHIDDITKGPIQIGNDVWIGKDVLVLGGVSIGDGSVIGAKSLVNKNIDSYTVNGGVPAKYIREREIKPELLSLMQKIDYDGGDYLDDIVKILEIIQKK